MSKNEQANLATAVSICARLQQAGHQAYFVGGAVRDQLLGISPYEYDIVTSALPEETRQLFAKTIPLGVQYGIVVVVEGGVQFQIASFRTEGEYQDGRHPGYVRFASAQEDVFRRDFTINGLLQNPISGEIIDYVGAKEDIANGIIRTIGTPQERFNEDFLRMLRAVRFATKLNFKIEEKTLEAIKANSAKASRISPERVRDELTKILLSGAARRGWEMLLETGLLAALLPELLALRGCEQPPRYHPEGDVWEHTLLVLAQLDKAVAAKEGFLGMPLTAADPFCMAAPFFAAASSSPASSKPLAEIGKLANLSSASSVIPSSVIPSKGAIISAIPMELAWAALLHDVGKPSTISGNFANNFANNVAVCNHSASQHSCPNPSGAGDSDSRGAPANAIHFYGHNLAGAAIAEKIAYRLHFSAAQREAIKELIKEHMRFIDVPKMGKGKLKRFLRIDNFAWHLELHRWDCLAAHGNLDTHRYCEEKLRAFALESESLHPPKLLNGRDLLKLGFAPGPELGKALVRIEEAQLEGLVASRYEALALAKGMLSEKL